MNRRYCTDGISIPTTTTTATTTTMMTTTTAPVTDSCTLNSADMPFAAAACYYMEHTESQKQHFDKASSCCVSTSSQSCSLGLPWRVLLTRTRKTQTVQCVTIPRWALSSATLSWMPPRVMGIPDGDSDRAPRASRRKPNERRVEIVAPCSFAADSFKLTNK